MTYEQIIKAFEICTNGKYGCDGCPYFYDNFCDETLLADAIAKIRQDKAYIEAMEEIHELAVERIKVLTAQLKNARTDSAREFAERVKAHTRHLFSGVDVANIVDDLVKREMTEERQ